MMNKALFSTGKDLWETPQKFFDELNNEFHFTLDACATTENAKCEKYFTEKDNALIQDWGGMLFSAILRIHGKEGKICL